VLETLHIRNLALVAGLEIEFGPGLNAVTGETGAGKSLVLGALQLLLGEPAGPGVIRRDADQCEIAATLRFPPALPGLATGVNALLTDAEVPACEDNQLLLRRVVKPSGSRSYVNGAPVTLQFLRQLGEALVDIHGPHEHQTLLQPRHQTALLDRFAGLDADAAECGRLHRQWQERLAALDAARAERSDAGELELLRHQLHEIEAANLDPVADARLTDQYRVAASARDLLTAANRCRNALTEADGSVTEQLGNLMRVLQGVAETDTTKGPVFVERLEQATGLLQELSCDLATYADTLELDEEELRRLEERLDLVQKLRRKHGPTLEDVLQAAAALRERLDSAEGRAERLHALEQACRDAEIGHQEVCQRLTTQRRTASGRLAREIAAKLARLGFDQSQFEVTVSEAVPGPRGADHVEFCFAPNPGEEVRPLRQIASSGEIARVMLAIKTVLSTADDVPILIFDEVDANIGGRIAVTVAEELAAIAARHQVVCITHLPQIAAAGQRHFRVTKRVVDERTITEMCVLDDDARRVEITRMLGAEEDSVTAAAHAREMLARAGKAAVTAGGRQRTKPTQRTQRK